MQNEFRFNLFSKPFKDIVCKSRINIMKNKKFYKDYKLLIGHLKIFEHNCFDCYLKQCMIFFIIPKSWMSKFYSSLRIDFTNASQLKNLIHKYIHHI